MRILFIGDIVGRSGRHILLDRMPKLIAEWTLDLVVVNGENAAGGFGITEAIYNDFIDAGADAVALVEQAGEQNEALDFSEGAHRSERRVDSPPPPPSRPSTLAEQPDDRFHALRQAPALSAARPRTVERSATAARRTDPRDLERRARRTVQPAVAQSGPR